MRNQMETAARGRPWARQASWVFLLGVGGIGLGSGACGDTTGEVDRPRSQVSVQSLDLPGLDGPYMFAFAVTGPSGFRQERTGLRPALYGASAGEITYVAVCDASRDGLNRVDLSVDRDPGQRTDRLAPRLLLPETQLGVRCAKDQDTILEQRLVAAELDQRPAETRIRFDDVRCVATQACAADGNALEVRCARPGGKPVALGIRDTRLVCAGLEEAVEPLGTTVSRLGVTARTRDVGGEDAAWRAEVSPSDLPGCRLEAELVAAPDLGAGRAPACHAWPVLEVAMPLGGACEASAEVHVAFAEAGGPHVDDIVENRAYRAAPPAPTASDCAARPLGFTTPSATSGDEGGQGFLDLYLELVLPR